MKKKESFYLMKYCWAAISENMIQDIRVIVNIATINLQIFVIRHIEIFISFPIIQLTVSGMLFTEYDKRFGEYKIIIDFMENEMSNLK